MMIKNIRLAVFDMSGTTIVDKSEVVDCVYQAALQTGIVCDKMRINSMMGWSKIAVFRTLWAQVLGSNAPELEAKAQHSFFVFKDILEKYYQENEMQPTEGCLEMFAFLKNNKVKIALNTGFYRGVANILLQKMNWEIGQTIDFLIASDEVQAGRPQPFMMRRIMKHFRITDPRQVIKVGDTPSDLGEGKAVGCWSFGLTNGSHTAEVLNQCEHDGLFGSLVELMAFLKK